MKIISKNYQLKNIAILETPDGVIKGIQKNAEKVKEHSAIIEG